ncbi:MAG: hypothetical protein LQ339_004607 [Xanthoria mediterranea]|nr:MAG: hypothetical protein LQ339_004607 [Xanthoria mediterranea]
MTTAGPELPPHLLAKRKRQQEAEEPIPKPQPHSPSSSTSSDTSNKRCRTIGPAPPPAPLSERPSPPPESQDPNENDSSSEDDTFGPSLPPTTSQTQTPHHQQATLTPISPSETAPAPPKREEWMLVPPSSSDWSSRIDPTKLRNRKFATGKGAKAPSSSKGGGGGIDTIWTETPEQKRQRLQDEMMGVKKPAQLVEGGEEAEGRRGREDEAERRETERRIREFNERNRGVGSLYEEHKKGVPKKKEDDPSKRAFDKEKDMGGGMKIGHAKRKEMVGKAADFGSRFAGGKYL